LRVRSQAPSLGILASRRRSAARRLPPASLERRIARERIGISKRASPAEPRAYRRTVGSERNSRGCVAVRQMDISSNTDTIVLHWRIQYRDGVSAAGFRLAASWAGFAGFSRSRPAIRPRGKTPSACAGIDQGKGRRGYRPRAGSPPYAAK
jgi:hypothetical protein